MKTNKELPAKAAEALLATLRKRFEKHPGRHPGIDWTKVRGRLDSRPEKLWSLNEMERTGGEPDVVGGFVFVDCSEESPDGRRSVCYDREGLESRKEARPKTSALDLAAAMGVELLNEEQYRELEKVGEFDLKTSSWLSTPAELRKLGGALFGDRRYGRVFTYHNGAQSYYAARGFRARLEL